MKNTVIIKGNKYGITIALDSHIPFSQLLEDLCSKLENAEAFFDSDRQLAITFEGRDLTNEELDELLYIIKNNSKLNIQYVMDTNSDLEATFFDIIQTGQKTLVPDQQQLENSHNNDFSMQNTIEQLTTDNPLKDALNQVHSIEEENHDGLFYRGTLRSGQSLETKSSLIIIGDVNPGASVVAGGNIVIIGSLKGSVTAGANGNRDSFVMALSMSPLSIQIADVLSQPSDIKKELNYRKREAMIASVINNHIHFEMVSKAAVQDNNM